MVFFVSLSTGLGNPRRGLLKLYLSSLGVSRAGSALALAFGLDRAETALVPPATNKTPKLPSFSGSSSGHS